MRANLLPSDKALKDLFLQSLDTAYPGMNGALYAAWLDTALGPMIAIASETRLMLLEFMDRNQLARQIALLKKRANAPILEGKTPPVLTIEKELAAYFKGALTAFHTPFKLLGTPFQQQVWQALLNIAPGQTRAYSEIAQSIGRPGAFRAVAQANAANRLALIVPCHRVITINGQTGGYAGGTARKQWLLILEKNNQTPVLPENY